MKKKKGELLNEAEKRTGLSRKFLYEKFKPKSNLDKIKTESSQKMVSSLFFLTDLIVVLSAKIDLTPFLLKDRSIKIKNCFSIFFNYPMRIILVS